jgi:hypothetical protein
VEGYYGDHFGWSEGSTVQGVNLIVMSPLKSVRRPNGKLLLTRKFVDGMALYRELWKGPVTLLCEPSEIESDNLDNIEISVEHAPFRTDLTWVSWTKLCERMSLGKELGYAEEEA